MYNIGIEICFYMVAQTRFCITCDKPVKGRTDKKFCDDYCRNNYNNQLNACNNNLVRNINNALGRNRRILESMIPLHEEMGKVSKQQLADNGFQFKYMTHTYVNRNGSHYLFCYDYGYLPLENDMYLVVKRKE